MEMNRGIWVVLAAVALVAIGLFVSQEHQRAGRSARSTRACHYLD